MMTATDIREQLSGRPFEPFRICLSDGHTLEVRHPDMCIVTRNIVHVGIPDRKVKGLAVRVAKCAIIHITRIEPLNGKPTKAQRSRRGQGGRP